MASLHDALLFRAEKAATSPSTKVFVLSPSNMRGIRARALLSPTARLSLVALDRSEPITIEEACTYTSSLYFRGKITYARRFSAPPSSCGGIYIIAPGFGLVPAGWPLDSSRFKVLRLVSVDPRNRRYRRTLELTAQGLVTRLQPDTQVVLLGSLAAGKYLDVLLPIFRDQLVVPRTFVGMGDMRRGAVLLRAASAGEELEYFRCSAIASCTERRSARVRRDSR